MGSYSTINLNLNSLHHQLIYFPLQIIDPDNAAKIDNIVTQLTKCRNGDMNFTLILDDSSGNSFIENPQAPNDDPLMTVGYYTRKAEQDAQLGIGPAVEEEDKDEEGGAGHVCQCLPCKSDKRA